MSLPLAYSHGTTHNVLNNSMALSLDGHIENVPTKILIDTGSSVTLIREDVYRRATTSLRRELLLPVPVVFSAGGDQLDMWKN